MLSYFGSNNDLKQLSTSYTINRLYLKSRKFENPTLSLLKIVMNKQIDLVINWISWFHTWCNEYRQYST